jgi:hypothetical protein
MLGALRCYVGDGPAPPFLTALNFYVDRQPLAKPKSKPVLVGRV